MTSSEFTSIDRFFIDFGTGGSPPSTGTIFVDGSSGSSFRPDHDLELSHWIPNSTPRRWAADTSTEICFRFIEDPSDQAYEMAVNNHIDVDGLLSVFVLTHPELTLAHRDLLVGAAEHGDLQASTSMESVVLAQELTAFVPRAYVGGEPLQKLYEEAFKLIPAILSKRQSFGAQAQNAWKLIEIGHRRIDDKTVEVTELNQRFVAFVLPELSENDIERALKVPAFSSLIDESVWLWPHSRNRDHGQKAQLVSVPVSDGWFHDLWLPGYVWADTPDRWSVPGLIATGGSNEWAIDHPALRSAINDLGQIETAVGRWVLASTFTPFKTTEGRGFPVISFFAGENGQPAPSKLPPEVVGEAMARSFC